MKHVYGIILSESCITLR